jgi:hypothetical protein
MSCHCLYLLCNGITNQQGVQIRSRLSDKPHDLQAKAGIPVMVQGLRSLQFQDCVKLLCERTGVVGNFALIRWIHKYRLIDPLDVKPSQAPGDIGLNDECNS